MDRVAAGETRSGDVKHVVDPVYEIRCTSDRREYRLLFAYAREFGLIALGLRFFVKKTQATPRRHIDVALERWKRWSIEHGEQERIIGNNR